MSPDVSVPPPLARRYQLEERLAAGAFGEVWRASDLLLNRDVAVKLLHASFARHPETLARFRAEAKNAGAVCHPNIAQVYDYGEPPDAPAPYLVMELVTGPSLQAVMAGGPLPPDRVLDIVAQVAGGLDAAHRAGLVHRDIKPGNLLLSGDGLVKITDFGISHAAGAAPVTRTGQLVGTPGYLAPERARGAQATPGSDLYSLGIVAWECLAGKPPYTGDVLAVASAHRDQPLPPLPATVPAEVAELVAALTAKEPSFRPESAADVAERAGQLRGPLASPGLLADPGPVPDAGPTAGLLAQTRELAATTPQALPPEPMPAAQAAPAARAPRAGHRRRGGRAGPIAAAVSAAAAVLLIAGLVLAAALSPGRTPARASGTAPRPGPTVLTVDAGSLIGQPVPVVVRHLERLGLRVRLQWQPSAAEPPGSVLAVLPGGPVRKGSLVTVVGSVAPRHGPGPGQQPPGQKKPHPGHGKKHATASLAAAPGGQDGDSQGGSSTPPPSPPAPPTDTPSPSPDPTPIAAP